MNQRQNSIEIAWFWFMSPLLDITDCSLMNASAFSKF